MRQNEDKLNFHIEKHHECNPLSTNVKAAALKGHGSIEQLEIMELPTPECEDNEVLIQVKAFALNRLDIWTREGLPSLNLDFPHVGASDFSGVVERIGSGVTQFQVGDRVTVNAGISCTTCNQCRAGEPSLCDDFMLLGEHLWGGAAEYAVVPEVNLKRLPDHISFKTAAAATLTALTTYRMLVKKAGIKAGDIVLIIGSGGGIGTMAVQMAKVYGGRVLAITSSIKKMDKARELGAEYVINYRQNPDWSKDIWNYTGKKGVDIIIDSTGEKVFKSGVRTLAKGGRYVTCGATSGGKGELNLTLLFWKQLEIIGSTMSSHKEFHEAMELVFQGRIVPVIDSVFSLDQIREAHKRLEDPEHMGKIVVEVE